MAAFPVDNCFPLHRQADGIRNSQIADSGLDVQWLLDTLWGHSPEFRDDLGDGRVVQAPTTVIGVDKGFLSKIYKTVFSFDGATAESFSVVIKVPSSTHLGKHLEASVARTVVENAHNVECEMYELLRTANCIPLPAVWYTRKADSDTTGVVLMNDLAEHGISLGSAASLTLTQLKNIVQHFAKFHAYQLCLDEQTEKRWTAIPQEGTFHVDAFPNIVKAAVASVPEYGRGEIKKLLDAVAPAINSGFFRLALIDRPRQLGLPLVVCNGDAGPNNMFFMKNVDGTASNKVSAFIDWQTVFSGNQMFDIARIAYGFCDADVRRDAERTLVPDYYASVAEEVTNSGKQLGFGIQQIHEAYALAGVHQALFLVHLVSGLDGRKDDYAPSVFDAWRHKLLLRAEMALRDAVTALRRYAPAYLQTQESQ
ncbi:Protein C04F6.7 [Aphelenchoides avenae]|nr:Protein C04F6.7 [Aphelenchus avenae]